jgi:hypothetical protein
LFPCFDFAVSAVHAEPHPAGIAACEFESPGFPVGAAPELTPDLCPFAVTMCEADSNYPAGEAQVAGYLAALNFLHEAPAGLAYYVLSAPDAVSALQDRAVDNGNFFDEAHFAAPPAADIVLPHTAADNLATGPVYGEYHDPIYSNRFYAAPSHDPNAHPNAVAHQIAN